MIIIAETSESTPKTPHRYKAFISYGHACYPEFACALQTALQTFGKPFFKRRAFTIFRDQTNLTATPALWPTIKEALEASEFLVLLASPAAAESQWVPREIDHWLQTNHGSTQNLIIVLTDGELLWNSNERDFDWKITTALPKVLSGTFADEPLYLDFRWAQKAEDLSLRNPDFLNSIATIAATLHGRPKSDLIGTDIKNHQRLKAIIATAFLLLCTTIAAGSIAGYMNEKRREAETNRRIAEEVRKQTSEAGAYYRWQIRRLEQKLKDAGLKPD